MGDYGTLLVLFVVAAGIAGVLHLLTSTVGPKAPNPVKDEPFECGNIAHRPFEQRVAVKFYVVALLFVVFDMEAVFLFPWAVVFRELGWTGFVSMLTFVLVLTVGLVYVWKRGALDWE
ncbi:MAG: NADH-quinone oxidoreductase subunit A [Myxococcota bacterium]